MLQFTTGMREYDVQSRPVKLRDKYGREHMYVAISLQIYRIYCYLRAKMLEKAINLQKTL